MTRHRSACASHLNLGRGEGQMGWRRILTIGNGTAEVLMEESTLVRGGLWKGDRYLSSELAGRGVIMKRERVFLIHVDDYYPFPQFRIFPDRELFHPH